MKGNVRHPKKSNVKHSKKSNSKRTIDIMVDNVNKVFTNAKNCKLVLTKFYAKDEHIDYTLPHTVDVLSNGLLTCKKDGNTRYTKECSEKFNQLIELVNKEYNEECNFFVYKEPGALPKCVKITPENIDIYKLIKSGNEAKRYKIKYNDNKSGVVMAYDHNVPYYKLQSVTTGEFLDIPEFTIDVIVDLNEVVLENVFNFVKYDYFFSEEQLSTVEPIIRTFKFRICESCGTPFYIIPRQLKFTKEMGLPLPVLCPVCAKKQRESFITDKK